MRALAFGLVIAAAAAAACERKAPAAPPPPSSPPPSQPRPGAEAARGSAACTLERATWRHPAVERVVAIGDVHGDRDAFLRALRLAGLVDADMRWTGGKAWLVQTGDLLDRGDDEQQILDDLERLEQESVAAGGRTVWLNGNHEVMNVAGDWRYVTPGGLADFEDVPGGRKAAFTPGGRYSQILAGQNLVAVVGDTAFVHGGIVPGVAAGLDDANHAARCWLAGQGPSPAVLEDDRGPLWDRSFGRDDVDCALLDRALAELKVERLVVGHTPQEAGVNERCDGKLWRIDVGLARHYGGPTQALELTSAGARVLR
jgi:hypothetical protein